MLAMIGMVGADLETIGTGKTKQHCGMLRHAISVVLISRDVICRRWP